MPLDAALYFFNHIFLPPKLPQAADWNPEYDRLLLDMVIDALIGFSDHVSAEDAGVLTTVITMVRRLRATLSSYGGVDEGALLRALVQLEAEGGLLPIYVRDQNAAVLLTRNNGVIHVESFELSPRNGPVIATVGRLQRGFPGPTLALDLATFNESGFQEAIAQALSTMSHQSVAGTKEKVRKAGRVHDEDREATHPKI
ncbi:hypothetical protein PHISCL_10388, partial [Aspergillus sclerotialis]